MTRSNYWVEKEDSTVFKAKQNSASAAVRILMSACGGDCVMAREYFDKWRSSEQAQDPELKHYIDCFEAILSSYENPQTDLNQITDQWWKRQGGR